MYSHTQICVYKYNSINLEQALGDKAKMSKALERAATASGLKEAEQNLGDKQIYSLLQ